MNTAEIAFAAELASAIRRGLAPLDSPEPLRLSQWAAEHFYLSAESSYVEGVWEARPYQPAIMDCMSNDDVRTVTVRKSARVGYTKMIVAAIGYFAEHRKRNQVVFQPVDGDADDFTKDEIDPMLRDCVAVQRVFPYYETKSKFNTLSKKVFTGSTLDIRGGKSPKNYRRLSKDVVYYDELDGFDIDVGGKDGEGDAVTLGDKRLEGATFPKSIRGSTPKEQGASLIEKAEAEADLRFEFHVPCPHCGHEQAIRWGGGDATFGFKWLGEDPSTTQYLCAAKACGALFRFEEYVAPHGPLERGRWVAEDGTWIDREGYFRTQGCELIAPPESVAFRLWTGMAGTVPWSQIVKSFLTARKDPSKLKTFVNTTLGESWAEKGGDRTDADVLYRRREYYPAQVPDGVLAIVASVDTQDDRFEIQFDGYGVGEERWSLSYVRLVGDPSRKLIWDKLAEELRRQFTRADGTILQVLLATQDHGGHYSDEVNAFSKRMGVRFLIPVKGSNQTGKPVATMPRKKNAKGVYLTEVGTDTAKSLLHQRYQIDAHDVGVPNPGFVHWPVSDEFDRTYFAQVTAEEQVRTYRSGVAVVTWDAKGRPNEATDCSVYSLAAIRLAQQHYGVRLAAPADPSAPTVSRPKRRIARSSYLGNR